LHSRHGDQAHAAAFAEETDSVSARIARQEALIVKASLQREDVEVRFPHEDRFVGVGFVGCEGLG
jgi:hypothetical protein